MDLAAVEAALAALANPTQAQTSAWFFKTGPGDYGEGDQFRGIRVPVLRKLARQARELRHDEVIALLHSPYHEDRLLALLIWVAQFERGDEATRTRIFDAYLDNTASINNWDLVDSSAPQIVGAYLYAAGRVHDEPLLTRLAQSSLLWERRIAIMATFTFIRQGSYDETLRLADLLLHDPHDLIHKAVGWMLREVGLRDLALEETFLAPRYTTMPRTMLRYAIEKFPQARRQAYLKGQI